MRDEIEIREDAARDIREINVDLAREQEEIARDLSAELEDIEADRLSSIEDRNIQHQQTLVDISRGASEDIQDIEIDLQRRIEDIERGLERDLASLSGTRRQRGERGVELRERAEQAIEDARINGQDDGVMMWGWGYNVTEVRNALTDSATLPKSVAKPNRIKNRRVYRMLRKGKRISVY